MSNELTAEELAELTADVRSAMPNWTLPMRAEKVSKILAALRARDERIAELEKVARAAEAIVAKCKLGNSNAWGLDALAENDIEHLYDALSALTTPSRQAPLDNSHVCDHRCKGESGHHAWPSPPKEQP
jgi:flagellar biosynthesis/type III secretory pathway chaperone